MVMVNATWKIKELKNELDPLKEKVKILEDLNDGLEARIKKVNDEKELLKTGLKDVEKERDRLKTEKGELETQVNGLQENLKSVRDRAKYYYRFLKIIIAIIIIAVLLFAFIGFIISLDEKTNQKVVVSMIKLKKEISPESKDSFHRLPEAKPATTSRRQGGQSEGSVKSPPTVIFSAPKAKKKSLKTMEVKKQLFSSFTERKSLFLPVFPSFNPEIFTLSFDSDTDIVSESTDGGVPP
jgi:FtsZ-binding cell division protein ZapB